MIGSIRYSPMVYYHAITCPCPRIPLFITRGLTCYRRTYLGWIRNWIALVKSFLMVVAEAPSSLGGDGSLIDVPSENDLSMLPVGRGDKHQQGLADGRHCRGESHKGEGAEALLETTRQFR